MTMPAMPTFKEFKGHELSAVLFILLCYFGYKEFTRGDECMDLRAENVILRKDNVQLRTEKNDLVNALLIKNGVIDAMVQVTDSTVRSKLPAKKLNIK